MKLKSILLTSVFSLAALLYQGCETVPEEQDPTPPPEVPQEVETQQEVGQSVGVINSDLATVNKSVDKFATVGESFTYLYEITPKTNLADAVLTDEIPSGLTYVSSSPMGSINGDDIAWNWDELDEGDTRRVSLTLRAEDVGTYRNCATFTAIPVACTLVTIGEAKLMVVKTVDRNEFKVGESANYRITVRNTGNATAKDVILTDTVPAGLADLQGRSVVTYDVGDLDPGEAKSYDLPLRTTASGEFLNVVTASAVNVIEDSDDRSEAPILVRVPGLEVEKTGTTEQFAGKRARYQITVRNSGETTLRNVEVVDTLPEEYRLVNADGGLHDKEAKTITWNIPSLPADSQQTYNITVVNLIGGTFINRVTASVEEDGLSGFADQPTVWAGYPALLLEVVDTADPLLVDDTTTFVIRVTNQGTANDFNVRVRSVLPIQLEATSTGGDSSGTIDGNRVEFAPIGVLAPKDTVEFRINARAVETGDGRIQVLMTSSLLEEPVTEQESTQVY